MFGKKKDKMTLAEEAGQNVFTTGIYHGINEEPWTLPIEDLPLPQLVQVIQLRADADGNWCIDNELVGDNENKMRAMIHYVSNEDNIKSAAAWYINNEPHRTIDYVIRDIANTSKYAC